MKIGEALTGVGRPVAYYPNLVPVAGSVAATVLLCQFLYWDGKQEDEEGWIYKTQAEIKAETGLSRYEQEGAREKLRKYGILEEKRAGIPAKLYFRINQDKLHEQWEAQSRMRENPIQGGSGATEQNAEKPQSLTTTETTTETTHRFGVQSSSPISRDMALTRTWNQMTYGLTFPPDVARSFPAIWPISWGDGVLTLHVPSHLARRKALAAELCRLLAPVAPVELREVRLTNGS